MGRNLICICLFLCAAVSTAVDAEVDPLTCNFQLNICTSKTSFLSAQFSIVDPEIPHVQLPLDPIESFDLPQTDSHLLNRIDATAHLSLPKKLSIDLNFKNIPKQDFTHANNHYAGSTCSIQTNCVTAPGVVYAKVQKFLQNSETPKETGFSPAEEIKISPFDIYSVGFKTAIGFLNFTPQIAYASDVPVYAGFQYEPAQTTQLILGVSADTNYIGFETELAYQNINLPDLLSSGPDTMNDAHLFGIYGDVWANLNLNKIGFQLAYGSWNDKTRMGYNFFNSYGSSLLTPQNTPMILGSTELNPWGKGLSGLIFGRIYGELALGSHLYLMPSLIYLTDHVEGVDASGYEINLAAAFNLTDILTYSAAVAFAETETITDLADPEINQDYKIVQKLQLKF